MSKPLSSSVRLCYQVCANRSWSHHLHLFRSGKKWGDGSSPPLCRIQGCSSRVCAQLGTAGSSDGITVNAIAPGRIATAMSGSVSPEENQKFINNSITKSLGTPDDIAYAVCYLASRKASFVTAETMAVNGGTLRD